jgi:peptidase M41-like protein
MAWGSAGQVFLGEDLMHTRDYSEDTSKIIDDEVERILRVEEQRAMDVLSKHRGGLNAIARALLDNEIIDGAEVARLVDEAHGSPVHDEGTKAVPHFHEAAINAPAANGAALGANGDTAHADATRADAESTLGSSAVAVPTAPPAPVRQTDPETWAPPPWPPPTNPAGGAPEGPAAR